MRVVLTEVKVASVSAVGGPIASRLTIRWMLIIGAATFPINGSAYYVSSRYRVDWYLILGRLIYGIGESGLDQAIKEVLYDR